MSKPDIKDTFVYQWVKGERGEALYLAIKHKQTLTGWVWQYSMVNRMQEAWQGPLPCNPRLIKSNLDVPMKYENFSQVHIRVTTTTNFELLRPPIHAKES